MLQDVQLMTNDGCLAVPNDGCSAVANDGCSNSLAHPFPKGRKRTDNYLTMLFTLETSSAAPND